MNYNKWLYGIDPEEMPRKIKKAIYGTKVSKSKLRRQINKGSLASCPACRHRLFISSTGNMVDYPEIWEYDSCRYCGFIIGGADNSIGTDILMTAKELLSSCVELERDKPFKTLYDAVKYIGSDMKDYI